MRIAEHELIANILQLAQNLRLVYAAICNDLKTELLALIRELGESQSGIEGLGEALLIAGLNQAYSSRGAKWLMLGIAHCHIQS